MGINIDSGTGIGPMGDGESGAPEAAELQVVQEASRETVDTIRINGNTYRP